MWANAASDLLQNDWQHPTPLWSSLYTSHTEKKKIKSESQIIVLMLQFTEEKTMMWGKKHQLSPCRACCTACAGHKQNTPDRWSDTGLGSALGSRQHWCQTRAALSDTTTKRYMNICWMNSVQPQTSFMVYKHLIRLDFTVWHYAITLWFK